MPESINGNYRRINPPRSNRSMRSPDIGDLISTRPDLLVRWGIYIMLGIFAGIFFTLNFIKTPRTKTIQLAIRPVLQNGSYQASGLINYKDSRGLQAGQTIQFRLTGLSANEREKFEATIKTIAMHNDSSYVLTIDLLPNSYSTLNSLEAGKATALLYFGNTSLFNRLFNKMLPGL